MNRKLEPSGIVETKTAPRRRLKFNCMNCLKAELDSIESAHDAGTLTTTGNWTAGQILSHCAIFMRCSMDGFPRGAPAPIRLIARLFIKKRALNGEPMPSGFQLPPQASFLLPQPDVSFQQGMDELRGQIARVDASERFEQPSPLLGPLTHDEWVRMHLGHCAMHLGFIDTAGAKSGL